MRSEKRQLYFHRLEDDGEDGEADGGEEQWRRQSILQRGLATNLQIEYLLTEIT